jgi:hypothetical protein
MSSGGTILTAEAVQIVKVNEDAHTFILSEEELTKLILKNDVKNRDVVIVSVAGAFRAKVSIRMFNISKGIY